MLLIIASIITLVYWVIWLIIKILKAIQKVGAFIFEARNYWTFVGCIVVLLIGTLLVAQFLLGLDPIGKFIEFILDKFQWIRDTIGNSIKG